jgi:mono/diheme cytochrome c family protein
MRTYANTIKPITSSQNCRTCHTNGAGSSYEFDAARKATIVRMAQTNGGRAGLNAQQVADIQAWFNADGPNDPTTF